MKLARRAVEEIIFKVSHAFQFSENSLPNLHAPLCCIFAPDSACSPLRPFIWNKSPTKSHTHLGTSSFQTHSSSFLT
ncbi:DUF6783 domain-containing protein [Lacrimispora indolis]|uniref:DUF6783 domain-containing protein n=1 Tax=Lacrimispora indolis TaxID=69825 RepID=UPI002FE56289